MPYVVVERTWESPITPQILEKAAQKMLGCIAARHGQWVRSMITPDGKRTICTFDAPDAESIRQSYREMGVEYDAIWTAQMMESPS